MSSAIPQKTDSINEMTGNILAVLDKIKADGIELDSPEDAIMLMMQQMGISEEEMERELEWLG